jgi:RHS repeat-associated protein
VTIDDGTRTYVFGLGLAYAVAGSAIEVQHPDRLGSIRTVTDDTGAVIATFRTDEFGVPTASTGSAGSPYRYTGEPADASGLTYLRARHYDASLGRFMSRDPFAGFVASPLSLNRYSYVENNPATNADPSGHCGVDIVTDIVFIGYDLLTLAFGPSEDRALPNE